MAVATKLVCLEFGAAFQRAYFATDGHGYGCCGSDEGARGSTWWFALQIVGMLFAHVVKEGVSTLGLVCARDNHREKINPS